MSFLKYINFQLNKYHYYKFNPQFIYFKPKIAFLEIEFFILFIDSITERFFTAIDARSGHIYAKIAS